MELIIIAAVVLWLVFALVSHRKNRCRGDCGSCKRNCKTDKDRNDFLLENMKNETDRRAKFASAVVGVFPNGDRLSAYGECHGKLLYEERGKNGFGYDPLFYMAEYGMTTAEMAPELKNRISHRAKAIAEFGEKLKEYLRQGE